MHRTSSIFALIFIISFAGASASAAVLSNVEGSVEVKSQSQRSRVVGVTRVQPGSTITTGANGRVTIVHDNGCTAEIGPDQSVTVQEAPTCTTAGTLDAATLTLGGTIIGGTIIALNQLKDDKPASP